MSSQLSYVCAGCGAQLEGSGLTHSCAAEIVRLRAREGEIEEALRSIWIYLRLDGDHTDHTKFGAACGVDACILCLAAETAKGALRGSR